MPTPTDPDGSSVTCNPGWVLTGRQERPISSPSMLGSVSGPQGSPSQSSHQPRRATSFQGPTANGYAACESILPSGPLSPGSAESGCPRDKTGCLQTSLGMMGHQGPTIPFLFRSLSGPKHTGRYNCSMNRATQLHWAGSQLPVQREKLEAGGS